MRFDFSSDISPTKTGECIQKFQGHWDWVSAVDVTGNYVFTASHDLTIRQWDINVSVLFSSPEINKDIRMCENL